MMKRKLYRSLYHHEHWFAEWWCAILLLSAGIYVIIIPKSEILHPFYPGLFKNYIQPSLV